MTSVERVMTYTKLDSGPGYQVDTLPSEHWPCEGNITFRDVSMMYYPGGPKALRNISLDIKGGSNIGVAGRTGAGKSSFAGVWWRVEGWGKGQKERFLFTDDDSRCQTQTLHYERLADRS